MTLRGEATGTAQVSCGDCLFMVPFSAVVAGVADATAPLLRAATSPRNPFEGFSVVASEPLPTTATARLVSSDGSAFDLVPNVVRVAMDDVPLVTGFSKPEVVLGYGQGYVVTLDGLVDFAGLRGPSDTTLRLVSFETPPLLPADGFESVTTAEVGGATVINAGGPLAPITGLRAVYFGASGAPSPTVVSAHVGSNLHLRLTLRPGDTTLSFSYRLLSGFAGAGFNGTVQLGSVGHMVGGGDLPTDPRNVQTMWPDGRSLFVSAVGTKTIALPPDVTGELLVAFEPTTTTCGGLPPPPVGLLVDDLRTE